MAPSALLWLSLCFGPPLGNILRTPLPGICKSLNVKREIIAILFICKFLKIFSSTNRDDPVETAAL